MQIIECEQRSEEWFRSRMGMPTASEFSTVMATGRGGGESKTRSTYMRKLVGEIITGKPMDQYTNAHMERGIAMEDEARDAYCFNADTEVTRVGFIVNGPKGCSPDSFIGANGMLEIKTALPHILIGYREAGIFPPEHKAQCQGALWVAEREWIDIAIYWPDMTLFRVRANRDEKYIAEIAAAVDLFNDELLALVERQVALGDTVRLVERVEALAGRYRRAA